MSSESRTNGTTPDEIEADIARQRDELASTVDALHAKMDVKTRAQDKAAELRDRATTHEGKPTPQVLAGAAAAAAVIGVYIALRIRRSR